MYYKLCAPRYLGDDFEMSTFRYPRELFRELFNNVFNPWCWNRKSGIKIGHGCSIDRKSHLLGGNVINSNSQILASIVGYGTYIGASGFIFRTNIGKYCSIGAEFRIIAGRHPIHFVSTNSAFFSLSRQSGFTYVTETSFDEFRSIDKNRSVEIGSDVWIGDRVSVLDGLRIGNGAEVAAGSVVTKDVPRSAIVARVPAKEIRTRFSESHCSELDESKWWNLSPKWLKKNANLFSNSVRLFNKRKDSKND